MGHPARTQRRGTTRSGAARKIAAQRAAERARRRRLWLAGGSVTVVIALVVAIFAVKALRQPAARSSAAVTLTSVAQQVTNVPAGRLSSVGTGQASALVPTRGNQPLLTSGGKPEVLYMGGEYCPFCAAERWALTVALSRFGTFSGLRFIHSAPDDGYIPTLTFYGSHYTSRYVSFDPVEWYSENSRVTLQQPTSAQLALFSRYNAPPYVSSNDSGGLPFVDIGNRYLALGAQYEPTLLSGLTWKQIAAGLSNPGSPVAQAIDGAANTITKALDNLTGLHR
ncbi:MAG TPA: DUF929 family protein [Streptosporangiaceae bacterium]|nr:DUF929 family protein [Streptosporangiaceae bacterium]